MRGDIAVRHTSDHTSKRRRLPINVRLSPLPDPLHSGNQHFRTLLDLLGGSVTVFITSLRACSRWLAGQSNARPIHPNGRDPASCISRRASVSRGQRARSETGSTACYSLFFFWFVVPTTRGVGDGRSHVMACQAALRWKRSQSQQRVSG